MEKIIQEKISADHLLYVSMKYTKTADVMLNLIKRWTSMIDESIVELLKKAKKEKKIPSIPSAPKIKVNSVKKAYKKDKEVMNAIILYEFFKKIPNLDKLKENEFRKHVTLKVKENGEWMDINMDKLKEYATILEKFISRLKQIL